MQKPTNLRIYVTKCHNPELQSVGFDNGIFLAFHEPVLNQNTKNPANKTLEDLPKEWNYPGGAIRAKYLSGTHLYDLIKMEVDAHVAGGTQQNAESVFKGSINNWLLELDVVLGSPIGNKESDIRLFVTKGPVRKDGLGHSEVSIWAKRPRFQIAPNNNGHVRGESRYWSTGTFGAGRLPVPSELSPHVNSMLQEAKHTSEEEWVGEINLSVLLKDMRTLNMRPKKLANTNY